MNEFQAIVNVSYANLSEVNESERRAVEAFIADSVTALLNSIGAPRNSEPWNGYSA